jgi:prefoldin subunit 5
MIVLGLPFWELYKGSMSALEKEKTLQKRIQELDHKLEHINKRIDKLQQVIVKRSVAKNLHKRESSTKTLKNNTG